MISVNFILHTKVEDCSICGNVISARLKIWQTPLSNTRLVSQKVIQFSENKLHFGLSVQSQQSSGKVSIITFCNTGMRVGRFSTSTNLAEVSIHALVRKFTHAILIFNYFGILHIFAPVQGLGRWGQCSWIIKIVLVRLDRLSW